MVLKILIILTLINYSISKPPYTCKQNFVLLHLKTPAYDFSMNILERVAQDNSAHFAFSPLSTWLQLNALAEGAKGTTLRELRNHTHHPRQVCFKRKFAVVLHKMARKLKEEYRRKSLMVINELLIPNRKYLNDVKSFYGVLVMSENYEYPDSAADRMNTFIARSTNDVIQDSLLESYFVNTVMVLSDNLFLKSAWKYPFNTENTRKANFTSARGVGLVNMMSTTGYFNTTELPLINAKVLEIPWVGDFSMLILMPLKKFWVGEFFHNLKRTTLNSIYNRFKTEREKLVTVKLPKFRINSMIENLPELLHDMGIKKIFDPFSSELPKVSYYDIYVSIMTQVSDVDVTENGPRSKPSTQPLINDTKEAIEFIANKPFAYLLVDKTTQFILFGGAYSVPSLY